MVLMLMMTMLTIMTMMMTLMMISILLYNICKIPKTSLMWVPDLGTSPGHAPIIAQSIMAVPRGKYYDIVVPDSREQELLYHSSSRLLGRYFEKRLDY